MAQPKLSLASRSEASLKLHSRLLAKNPGARKFELIDHPAGPDWVHPSIAVHETHSIGLGLVALDFIPRGNSVILFGGTMMSWAEVLALPSDMWDIPYQISDDIFFGIAKPEDLGIGERINHSCNPNAGFVSEIKLVAIRDILPGDQVTMDYATCSSMDDYTLTCRCGENHCRGIVRGDDWKNRDLQRRLGSYYQPYLKEKVEASRSRGVAATISSVLHRTANLISKAG